jgi:hypothetical protein
LICQYEREIGTGARCSGIFPLPAYPAGERVARIISANRLHPFPPAGQAGRCDSRIEPVACGEEQGQADDSSAIIEIVRREGQHTGIEEE